MKIGILTFNREMNTGAVLQAFALQQTICRLGYAAKLINFSPWNRWLREEYLGRTPKVIFAKLRWLPTRLHYRKILSETLLVYTAPLLRLIRPHFDLYIVGSDQVWNHSIVGDNDALFFSWLPDDAPRFSYAASAGRNANHQWLKTNRHLLSKFRHIFVREDNLGEYLHSFLPESDIRKVADPTLLPGRECYMKLVNSTDPAPGPYLFSYVVPVVDIDVMEELCTFVCERLKCTWRNYHNPYQGAICPHTANFISEPRTWLTGLYHSVFVLCTSFHALIFSLLFHKPFVYMQMPTEESNADSRAMELLNLIGYAHRAVPMRAEKTIRERLSTLCSEQIDWEAVDAAIDFFRQESLGILKSAISEVQRIR